MLASRSLLRAAAGPSAPAVARFAAAASASSAAPEKPSIKSTFVTVSNGGIVPISKEQYIQLNSRPKRISKESIAFSAALVASLAAGGVYLYQNWEEEPVKSKRETAVAHSSAAWARLKDVFTLSDSHVEIIDSDNSAGHKFKEGWNNGVRSFRDAVRGLFEK